jgi:hypothetical protein
MAIAGLDGEYVVGDVGAAGAGVGTGGNTTSATGAAGSGASVGGGSTGGQGQGATGSGTSTEDCLDGIDNDGNALVDCADPACQPDFQCAPLPPVPPDWTGYVGVDTTSYPASSTDPCADASSPDVLFSGPGGSAQCASCSCGNPSGGSCSYPTMSRWKNQATCTGYADDLFAPGNGNCYQFPTDCGATCSNDQRLQLVSQSTLTATPSCSPSGGATTLPDLWTDEHHLCPRSASGGGGCPSGQACVSTGTSFGGACVRRDGSHGCPTEFPNALTAYAGASDDRGCSACGCNAASVTCTGGSFTISDDTACQGGTNPDISVSGTTCVSARNHLDEYGGSYRAVAGTLTGSCTVQGGQPTGSVTPSAPITLCCL